MRIFTSRIYTYSLLALSFLFVLTSCSKDDPEEINEEEEINRVTLQITPAGGAAQTYTWNDGGESNTSISLAPNTTYQVSVSFFDASDADDIENITEEVIEEADEHQVFYAVADLGSNLAIASGSGDTEDGDGNPVLLQTQWTTVAASSGTVRVFLIHEPTTKTGTSRDDFGGETDVEVNFTVTIE